MQLNKLNYKFDLIVSRGIILSHYNKKNAIHLLNSIYDRLSSEGYAILDFLNKESIHKYKPCNKTYYTYHEFKLLASSIGFNCSLFNDIAERVLIIYLTKT